MSDAGAVSGALLPTSHLCSKPGSSVDFVEASLKLGHPKFMFRMILLPHPFFYKMRKMF